MAPSSSKDAAFHFSEPHTLSLDTFPACSQLESTEQIRRFELLRLAFFALKLRRLERRTGDERAEETQEQDGELELRRSLLRHAIFQQVLALIQLDARQQAKQIIEACQK